MRSSLLLLFNKFVHYRYPCGVAEIQRQNERRCEEEIENYKSGVISGAIVPESSTLKFSEEALDEQKHAIRIADEKVALAVQAYDLVQNMHSSPPSVSFPS